MENYSWLSWRIGFIENKILFNCFFFLDAKKGLTHGLLMISFFDDSSLATPKKRTSYASAPISGNTTEISTKGK